MVNLLGEASTLLKLGKWVSNSIQIVYYAHKSDMELEMLSDKLGDLQEDITKLYQYVKDTHEDIWSHRSGEIDATLRNLVSLDEKLLAPPKSYKFTDTSQKLTQFISRFEAINFLNDYVPVLSDSIAYLRSNTINLDNREIQSTSDFASLLESLSDKIRTGNILDLDGNIRAFEEEHKNSATYRAMRDYRLKDAKSLRGKIKRIANKKSIDNFNCYASSVQTAITNYPADYHPKGKYIPRIRTPNIIKKGKQISTSLFHGLYPIDIQCNYDSRFIDSLDLKKAEKKAKKQADKRGLNYLMVECKVADVVSDSVRRSVALFDSSCYTPFLYELDTGRLTYNKNSRSAKIFDGFFDPNKNPKTARSILKDFEVDRKIFGMELEMKLGLSDKRIEEMVKGGLLRKVSSARQIYVLTK